MFPSALLSDLLAAPITFKTSTLEEAFSSDWNKLNKTNDTKITKPVSGIRSFEVFRMSALMSSHELFFYWVHEELLSYWPFHSSLPSPLPEQIKIDKNTEKNVPPESSSPNKFASWSVDLLNLSISRLILESSELFPSSSSEKRDPSLFYDALNQWISQYKQTNSYWIWHNTELTILSKRSC